jgi:hypothetical protein
MNVLYLLFAWDKTGLRTRKFPWGTAHVVVRRPPLLCNPRLGYWRLGVLAVLRPIDCLSECSVSVWPVTQVDAKREQWASNHKSEAMKACRVVRCW